MAELRFNFSVARSSAAHYRLNLEAQTIAETIYWAAAARRDPTGRSINILVDQ